MGHQSNPFGFYDAPTANSDANLLPSGPFIAGELIGDLRFVTDDYHGELVRHDVLLRHLLYLLRRYLIDVRDVRVEILIAEVVQIDILELSNQSSAV